MKQTRTLLALLCLAAAQAAPFHPDIQPFPLSAVKLAPGSTFDKATSLNVEYMLSLMTDDLLRTFRQNAGFATPGQAFSGA